MKFIKLALLNLPKARLINFIRNDHLRKTFMSVYFGGKTTIESHKLSSLTILINNVFKTAILYVYNLFLKVFFYQIIWWLLLNMDT